MSGNDLTTFLGVLLWAGLLTIYLGTIIFVLTMLWRITKALERMARHQLEMARDIKRVAEATDRPAEPSQEA